MLIVKVTELKPDQILSDDIKHEGQILLRKGAKLTASIIKTLISRGVEKVSIVEPKRKIGCNPNLSIPPAIAEKAHAMVDKRFIHNHTNAQHPMIINTKEFCYWLTIDHMLQRGEI